MKNTLMIRGCGPRCRWPAFSLRSLLTVVTGLCVVLGLWASRERAHREQLAAVKSLYETRFQRGTIDANPLAGISLSYGRRTAGDDALRRGDVVTYACIIGGQRSQAEAAAIKHLPTLRAVEASGIGCAGATDAEAVEIGKLFSLEWLDLQHTRLTDRGVRCLASLRELRELNLSDTDISGEGFSALSGLHKLEKLDLHHSGFADEGARHLGALDSLRFLDLAQTKIGDAGLKYLSSLPNLNQFELAFTDISDVGLRHLAKLPSLRSLNLVGTKVKGDAFAYFRPTGALESVWLDGASLTDSGARHLARLRSIRELDVSSTNISDAALEYLSRLEGLEVLYVQSNPIGDRSMPYLAKLANLYELSLANTRVSDEGIKSLHPLGSLEAIYLDGCDVSDVGLKYVSELKSLLEVKVREAPRVTAAGVAELKRLRPRLQIDWAPAVKRNRDDDWIEEDGLGEETSNAASALDQSE